MLIMKGEEIKKAFENKPYPFTVTERTYNEFPDAVKELGWIFNLHSRLYTHYFNQFIDFIHFALLIYGKVKVL